MWMIKSWQGYFAKWPTFDEPIVTFLETASNRLDVDLGSTYSNFVPT